MNITIKFNVPKPAPRIKAAHVFFCDGNTYCVRNVTFSKAKAMATKHYKQLFNTNYLVIDYDKTETK